MRACVGRGRGDRGTTKRGGICLSSAEFRVVGERFIHQNSDTFSAACNMSEQDYGAYAEVETRVVRKNAPVCWVLSLATMYS